MIFNIGLQVHALSGLVLGTSSFIGRSWFNNFRKERELVIWDYIKKNPQDFPEVFNRKSFKISWFNNNTIQLIIFYFVLKIAPKKYKELLLPWRPTRQIIIHVKIESYERSNLLYTLTNTPNLQFAATNIFLLFFRHIFSLLFFLFLIK